MRSQDRRRPPLPVHLTSAQREFYTELRRLVDVSGLSADELSGTAAGASAWDDWLNGQSLPAQRAVRELASGLAASGSDTGRLLSLWVRAFLPTSYPAEPGRSPIQPRQLPIETGDFTGRSAELAVLEDLGRQVAAPGDATVIVIEGPAATGKTALANRVAHQLSDAGAGADDPLAIARTVLAASCARLSDGAARMFRLLSIGPGPDMGLAAAASLAAIPADQARSVLHELTAAYLVEEYQPGRFVVHDLPRRYAADLARAAEGGAELDAATRRLLDYYLRGMHAGMSVIYPARPVIPLVPPMAGVQAETFGSSAQAMAWCRAQRPEVQALVTYAAGRGDFGAYCWQLPWAMAPLLARGGFLHDYLALARIAVAAAAALGDPLGQGVSHYDYAHACALLGAVGESGAHLKEALQWFTKAGDRMRAARTLNGMAQLLMQDGDYPRALDRENEALQLRRAGGDPDEIAHSEQTIGNIYALLGRHDEAVRHAQHSLDLSRETGNRALTADTLATLGFVYLSLGDYDRAVACYMEVLVIYREIGDKAGTAGALTGLGDARQARGDVRAARAAWRQALAILGDVPSAAAQPIQARLGQLG